MQSPASNKFRFTNRSIEQLPPQDPNSKSTEKEYSDLEVSGLRCLVGKNGTRKFLLRYIWRGRKKSIALGHFGPLSVSDARQLANEHKRDIVNGTDPRQARQQQNAILTLDEFARAAQSIKALTDYLERHPESLLKGKGQ